MGAYFEGFIGVSTASDVSVCRTRGGTYQVPNALEQRCDYLLPTTNDPKPKQIMEPTMRRSRRWSLVVVFVYPRVTEFSTRHQWFACARLLSTYLTKSRSAFSSTLTTPALYRRSLRWFEAYPGRPTPKDLPSSIAQHGCSRTFINYINTPSRLLGTPSSRCHLHWGKRRIDAERFFLTCAANIGPNRFHHARTVS